MDQFIGNWGKKWQLLWLVDQLKSIKNEIARSFWQVILKKWDTQ
jgi:hypothetical protein